MNYKIGKWHKFVFHHEFIVYLNKEKTEEILINKKEITFLLLEIKYNKITSVYEMKILYEGKVCYFDFWENYLENLTCLS